MSDDKYKSAYERQKVARERAEQLLENKSRELYDANQSLTQAYEKLKSQKNQLYHQEKLASIGLLGAGVAHEINNPAGFIRSNLSTLMTYLQQWVEMNQSLVKLAEDNLPEEKQAQVRSLLDDINYDFVCEDAVALINESRDGVDRIESIVKGLKDFSRPDAAENENFDLNKCIEMSLNLLKHETKHKADVNLKLGAMPEICGRPGSIGQIVVNLIVNACHAIKDYGIIEIRTFSKGRNGVMVIRDNGCGISQKNLYSIFDPFFTTKDVGEGTGLGLSISHSIVKQHGGSLTVESTEGEGTTFTMSLPLGECVTGAGE